MLRPLTFDASLATFAEGLQHLVRSGRRSRPPVPSRPESLGWHNAREGGPMELPIRERVSDPGVTPSDDERVFARIAAGDAASLRRLFSRHAPLTVAIIAHLVGRSQAQDIVQETFLLLWNQRWHKPDEGSVQTWVLGTAHSRALELIREGENPPTPADRRGLAHDRRCRCVAAAEGGFVHARPPGRRAAGVAGTPRRRAHHDRPDVLPWTLPSSDRRTARCAALGDPAPVHGRPRTTRAVAPLLRTAGLRRPAAAGSDQPRIRASRYPAGSALPRVNR